MWKKKDRAGPPPPMMFPPVPAATQAKALRWISEGKMIKAIKEIREDTRMGLKEAKDYAEALAAGQIPPVGPPIGRGMLSDRVRTFKRAEDYESAIALVRAETGMTRSEAIRFVDALE